MKMIYDIPATHARLFDASERGQIDCQVAAVLYESVNDGTINELDGIEEYAEYLVETGRAYQ